MGGARGAMGRRVSWYAIPALAADGEAGAELLHRRCCRVQTCAPAQILLVLGGIARLAPAPSLARCSQCMLLVSRAAHLSCVPD